MTPADALQVQEETDVSADYLLSGDVATPMLDRRGILTRVTAIMLNACKKNKPEVCFLELSAHLESFEKRFPQDRKLYTSVSQGPLVQLGKLAESMRELSHRFEHEVNQHCLREHQKLIDALSPTEKARLKATLKMLQRKGS